MQPAIPVKVSRVKVVRGTSASSAFRGRRRVKRAMALDEETVAKRRATTAARQTVGE
jgi:hypothetical protein